jgi:hypothetical protein
MHFRLIERAGDDLHWLAVRAITADISEVSAPFEERFMPPEKHAIGERFRESSIKIHHHLSDPLFGRTNPSPIRRQAELSADRGLDADAIKDFALDLGCGHGFGAHRLDDELCALRIGEMPHRTCENAAFFEKLLLRPAQTLLRPRRSLANPVVANSTS